MVDLIWCCGIRRLKGEEGWCSEREEGGHTHDEGMNGVEGAQLTQRLHKCPFLYSLARRGMLGDNHSRWE